MPSAIVLAIDGLGAKHLGPYGNTWVETPAFNRLAVESLLIDGLYAAGQNAPFSELSSLSGYPVWWHYRNQNWIPMLQEHGIRSQLLTDEALLWDLPQVAAFDQQDRVETPGGVQLAPEWQETHAAGFFAQAMQAIEALDDNTLLWLHFRGFQNPWDAPYAYRQQFVDEEDPDATGSAQVPCLTLDRDYDPDTLHEIQCAHAGQVVLFDECLAVLYSVIAQTAAEHDTMFLVVGTRGFPLGEHLQVGFHGTPGLYHEWLSVPAFLRYPQGHLAMKRKPCLAETEDMVDALHTWLVDHQIKPDWNQRDFSVSRSGSAWLLRTFAWHLKFNQLSGNAEQDLDTAELYLQPDDQNEINDVSDRCESVVLAGYDFLRSWNDASQPPASVLPVALREPME